MANLDATAKLRILMPNFENANWYFEIPVSIPGCHRHNCKLFIILERHHA